MKVLKGLKEAIRSGGPIPLAGSKTEHAEYVRMTRLSKPKWMLDIERKIRNRS